MMGVGVLDGVKAQIARVGLTDQLTTQLRQCWPGLSFTQCAVDDVPARLKPVGGGPGYSLFLVQGAAQCVAFTQELAQATGLVIAAHDEDHD